MRVSRDFREDISAFFLGGSGFSSVVNSGR